MINSLHIKKKFFIAIFISIIVSSCVNQNNYKIYSFFFDGVPDPSKDTLSKNSLITNSAEKDSTKKTIAHTPANPDIVHPPYADKACKDCHEFGKKMILKEQQPDLCYQCHNDLSKEYKVLHGPVAGGFCTSCHNPHSSKFEKLLIAEKNSKFCYTCHVIEDVLKNSIHSEDMNCFDCHNPHGGDDQSFQK